MRKIFKILAVDLVILFSLLSINNPVFSQTTIDGKYILDGSLSLTSKVKNVLPVINGGTGVTSFTVYTDSMIRGLFSASLPLGYNSTTGVFSIQIANTSQSGYLSSGDWNLFNGKQASITTGTTAQYFRGDLSLATFPTTTASFTNSTDKNFVTDSNLTVINNTSGINTGDNATNSQYSGLAASKQDALGFTPENVANKDTDSTFAANSDTKYPSQKAVKTATDGIQSQVTTNTSNIATNTSNIATNTSDIANRVTANVAITGATKTKITYDTKGLVTSGADATTADIADSSNKRYVTDANLTVIGNTSGTNTGNETALSIGTILDGTSTVSPATDDHIAIQQTGISYTLKNYTYGALKTAVLSGNATTATTATNATNTSITDDTTTNATMYPTWVTSNTGNLPQKVSSSKVTFNPSTGVFTATSFTGAGTGLTGTASSLTAGAVTNGAYLTASNAFTKQNTLTPQTLTSSSNHIAWDANNGNSAVYTATENTTLDNPTNLVTGTVYTFQFTQHASSAKTLAFGTKWKFVSGTPTITTTLSGVQYIQGIYDGTNINCSNPIGPFS